jgi:hypothetical protein
MSFDLLLHWMTQKQEGSWAAFRGAISRLALGADQSAFPRRLRVTFSDLGHVDFFVEGSQRWRILPPMLAGLSADGEAVLCGARTPHLVKLLQSTAGELGCDSSTTDLPAGVMRISVHGAPADIQKTADRIHIDYVPRAAARLLGLVHSIHDQVADAPQAERPFGWEAHSFDMASLVWVEGVLANSACRFTPKYGPPRFLLHRRRGKFTQLSKREAVYAAAMLQGVSLVKYVAHTGVLRVPLTAPLPEGLGRVACLCTGIQPRIEGSALEYAGVPIAIGATILAAVGQPHSEPIEITETVRCSVG